MSLNPEISQISYRQSVTRKAPVLMRVLLLLMYVCVGLFTFLGTMWGFPMLVLSLGTLAFAWYYKGEISVSYEYQIDGTHLTIRRLSGPARSRATSSSRRSTSRASSSSATRAPAPSRRHNPHSTPRPSPAA